MSTYTRSIDIQPDGRRPSRRPVHVGRNRGRGRTRARLQAETSRSVQAGSAPAVRPEECARRCVVSVDRRHMCQDMGDTNVRESSRGQGPVSGRGACVGGTLGWRAGGCARGSSQLDLQAPGSLPGRRAARPFSHAHAGRAPARGRPPRELVAAIVKLRGELEAQGYDAGAADDRLPPRPTPQRGSLALDDLAHS